MGDNNILTRCIEELEIKGAMWQCGSSKSPCLDGFTFSFIKKH